MILFEIRNKQKLRKGQKDMQLATFLLLIAHLILNIVILVRLIKMGRE